MSERVGDQLVAVSRTTIAWTVLAGLIVVALTSLFRVSRENTTWIPSSLRIVR